MPGDNPTDKKERTDGANKAAPANLLALSDSFAAARLKPPVVPGAGDAGVDPAELARQEISYHEEHESERSLLARAVGFLSDGGSRSLADLKKTSIDYGALVMKGDQAGAKALQQQLIAQVKEDQAAVGFKDTVCDYGSGFVKTMGLFMRGRAGMLGLSAYALDAINPEEKIQYQLLDGALGYTKGFALQQVLSKAGQIEAPIAMKGAVMGLGSRVAEIGLDRHTYLDRQGNFNGDLGVQTLASQLLNKEALITDAIMFSAAHGFVRGGNAFTRGLIDRSVAASTAATAFSFGLLSGSSAEVQHQTAEGRTLTGLDFGRIATAGAFHAVLDAIASGPGAYQAHAELNARLSRITDGHKFAEIVAPPQDMAHAINELKDEFRREVPVRHEGKLTDPYTLVQADPLITARDKSLIWSALATARNSFQIMESRIPEDSPSKGYQWEMNWKHTRAEFAEAWEAVRTEDAARRSRDEPGLTSEDVRNALIASMYSDHIKIPGPRARGGNFIVHNIHGAEAAAQVLSHLLNPNDPADMRSIEQVVRGIREHQVAPPGFMAQMTAVITGSELGMPTFNRNTKFLPGADADLVSQHKLLSSIYDKINDPYQSDNLTTDRTRIDFTPEERQLLAKVDIKEWYVPHPLNPESFIARIVIPADHSINYNIPDGLAKFAFIREPGKEAIFQDATFKAALDTVIGENGSFASSRAVLDPQFYPVVDAKFERTLKALDRAGTIMDQLFKQSADDQSRLNGAQRYDRAVTAAANLKPDLFATDSTVSGPDELRFMQQMRARVGELLDQWQAEHGATPLMPDSDAHRAGGTAGKLPYWNMPLQYPMAGIGDAGAGASLNPLAQTQFAFAKVISRIGVQLLRGEHWRY